MNILLRLRIPNSPSKEELARLYTACFRIIGVPCSDANGGLSPDETRSRQDLRDIAEELFKATLLDSPTAAQDSLVRTRAAARQHIRNEHRALTHRQLPHTMQCPWSRAVAEHQLEPYLQTVERRLQTDSAAHLDLAWIVHRHGNAPFKQIVGEWMTRCDMYSLGLPGSAVAVPLASQLFDETRNFEARIEQNLALPSWQAAQGRLMPLLNHPHRLVVAHAARTLGTWYAGAPPCARPPLSEVLGRIRDLPRASAAAAGGFVSGFDGECTGLATLTDALPDGFDLDTFAIDILSQDDEPPLPAIQSFGYYVQEYYDHSPGFVHRLIDRGLPFLAVMCATEWQAPVVGMDGVLHRLAAQPDPEIAARAFDHLAMIYCEQTTHH